MLRPEGVCFATYLLLDETRRKLADAGSLPFSFRVRKPEYWAVKPRDLEAVVAYPRQRMVDLFGRLGFADLTVHDGRWDGRADGLGWQDTVVAIR